MSTLQESRWVGRVLRDKWRIERKIARGGMGTVFAATHKNNGARAAIKVLHPEFSRDADTKSRFIQEGYAANQVGHAGVVRILDDDVTEEGAPFIVMELLQGELLEQRRILAGGRLPVDEVIEVADQLLDVIVAAHAKGIVHRDIKPDNIFVTEQGLLKVLDFGFARMRDGMRTEQTATGFLLGTPGFMAPEQAAGHRDKIDARTDIWAIGATLFVLLTGQPVHEGESAAEMLVAAANYPVRPIGELEPGLPVKLRAAIDRALAFDRNGRWPDAKSMLLSIRTIPRQEKVTAADDDGRTLMRPSPKAMPAASPAQDDGRTLMRPSPAAGAPPPGMGDDGRTVMRQAPSVSGAQHEDPTVMGIVEELGSDALQSIYTPTSPLTKAPVTAPHPADQEPSTLAIDPDGPTIGFAHSPGSTTQKVEMTQKVDRYASGPEQSSEHTVMMASAPRSNLAGVPSPLGEAPTPLLQPAYTNLHQPSHEQQQYEQQQAQAFGFQPPITGPLPRLATTNVAHPSVAKKEGKGGSLLVFIAVAGITMIVVILTGLVVIMGTE